MLQRYLVVWLTLLCLVAWLWPQWNLPYDPFLLSKPLLKHLFAATMFCIGGLLPRDEIAQVRRRWPTVLGGTAVQYTVMPLLAYGIAHAFQLSGEELTGVILVGCVPGAMASNVLTLSARGNVSYSVSLTTSATLLSPLVVPVTLYLAVRQGDVDRGKLMVDAFWLLLFQVVGPVVLGHWLAQRWQALQTFLVRWGPVIANLAILWIIAVIVNLNHTQLRSATFSLAGILLLINLGGYTAGYLGGTALRLTPGMRRALTLEIGMQNAGLGSVLATELFGSNPLIALPPAAYMFGCMLTGTILAQVWALMSRDEPPLAESAETDGA